jgi:uncharacterized protein
MQRRTLLGGLMAAPTALALRLREAVDRLEIVSSHEHLLKEQDRIAKKADFFALASQYLVNDLITAGAPANTAALWEDPKAHVEDKWRAFQTGWRGARFTGYGQAFRTALSDLYGVKTVNRAAVEAVNAAVAAHSRPGFYRWVLKERARIRYSVLDDYWNGEPERPDPEFFVLSRKFDWFITVNGRQAVERMEQVTGVEIDSVTGLKRAMERRLEQSLAAGLAAIKTTLAYQRPLYFAETGSAEAERGFEAMMRGGGVQRPLSDHLFHHLLGMAQDHGLPVQVHTGIQAGNNSHLPDTHPELLTNVLRKYTRVTFDLFHIGFPYVEEMTGLSKMFPNVYADFCWAHVLSPATARRALGELLDAVPFTKILGFGGDYRYAELTYAHAEMARDNIAQVLGERIEAKWCTEDEALEIARALLADNAARLYPQRVGR